MTYVATAVRTNVRGRATFHMDAETSHGPDIAVLNAFNVAFLIYSVAGECRHVSAPARDLLSRGWSATAQRMIDLIGGHVRRGALSGSETPLRFESEGLDVTGNRRTGGRDEYVVVPRVVAVGGDRPPGSESPASHYGLTAREHEVAQLIARGKTTKEIAADLIISGHTARHHTERLFTKLGVHGRAQVILMFTAAAAPGGAPAALSG